MDGPEVREDVINLHQLYVEKEITDSFTKVILAAIAYKYIEDAINFDILGKDAEKEFYDRVIDDMAGDDFPAYMLEALLMAPEPITKDTCIVLEENLGFDPIEAVEKFLDGEDIFRGVMMDINPDIWG